MSSLKKTRKWFTSLSSFLLFGLLVSGLGMVGCPAGPSTGDGGTTDNKVTDNKVAETAAETAAETVADGKAEIVVGKPCPSGISDCNQSNVVCIGDATNKYCTFECTSDEACKGQGKCVDQYCRPTCEPSTDPDCKALINFDLCKQAGYCGNKSGYGGACKGTDECPTGLQCEDPLGVNSPSTYCTKTCADDTECNIAETQGKCGDPGSGRQVCLPNCASDADCASYTAFKKCNMATSQCWFEPVNP
ncbi:MAG: hypothetical protein H6728_03735 [Myxococcales bacterium]|nr:hypothetical protein [Myxococcales bacterium]